MQPDESFALIEDQLRRGLMPVAMSDSGTESIHALLDELAGDESSDALLPVAQPSRMPWVAAAAAAVAVLFAVTALRIAPVYEETRLAASDDESSWSEENDSFPMHLVDESTRLAWVEDEGMLADPDGGALHAVRMGVIEENRLLDEETGIIVNVSSPREEMLLMPVTTF